MKITLCQTSDLTEGACQSAEIPNPKPGEVVSVFATKREGQVFAYVNECPHLNSSLEFMPNQFLTHDKSLIQCSLHGALFDIKTGECIHGPCLGQKLKPLHATESDGQIILQTDV